MAEETKNPAPAAAPGAASQPEKFNIRGTEEVPFTFANYTVVVTSALEAVISFFQMRPSMPFEVVSGETIPLERIGYCVANIVLTPAQAKDLASILTTRVAHQWPEGTEK